MLDVSRRELKYPLTLPQIPLLRRRLSVFLLPDRNAQSDGYLVRSLYFDTPGDRDFQQKVDGCDHRRKIRLRIYDRDGPIKLELKEKHGGFQRKRSLLLCRPEADAMTAGSFDFLRTRPEPTARELYQLLTLGLYRPKCIVQYRRIALFAPENDTRVTFDYDLRAGEGTLDLFSFSSPLYPAAPPEAVTLEVKYNGFLLSNVKLALGADLGSPLSGSKYCRARSLSKHGD